MTDFSPHARRRCAQRSIPDDHIELALNWGTPIVQEDGRVAWHLGWRDAEAARALGATIPDSAVGVAVVVAEDGTVVTAVRSPNRHRLRVRRTRRPRGVR